MKNVPNSLRYWFLLHFALDIIVAVPLIVMPVAVLQFVGLPGEGVLTARLIGAALIGIGGASLLENKMGKEGYNVMLTLKILWSVAAQVVLLLSIYDGAPSAVWGIFTIFFVFSIVWIRYKFVLNR